jgi:cell volume regulation protein A
MENGAMSGTLSLLSSVSIILIIGMIAGRIAALLRVPDVVLFLLVGILVGPHVLNLLRIPEATTLNQLVLVFGASYILFEGGASIRFDVIRKVFPTVFLLATLGVLITMGVTGYLAHGLLGIPLLTALLLGAIVSGTDPATLIPVFKQVSIRPKVAQTVISESAFNDATSAIAFFVLLSVILGGKDFQTGEVLWDFARTAGGGVLVGFSFGLLGAVLIAHRKYNFFLEYAPLLTVFVVITAYETAEHYHLSGFMAVFIAGILFGNINNLPMVADEKMDHEMHHFIEVISLGLRMAIFIVLGSHVDLHLVGEYFWDGLLVALGLIFIARPIAVLICTLPDRAARWETKEILFLFWTRETGVIPAALSGLVMGSGLAEAQVVASATFVVILTTILLQATTAKWLAGRLGLLNKE